MNYIKKFNKLNKERKSLYWLFNDLEDREKRIKIRKAFIKVKAQFMQYKNNKNLLDEKAIKKLKENLNLFKTYLKYKKVL